MENKKIAVHNDILLMKSLKHIASINQYVENYSFQDFLNDSKTVDACITRLTQIGELERRFSLEFKETFDEIPWREINGLRNIVVHNYDGIIHDAVWETIKEDLPDLEKMYVNLLLNVFEKSLIDLKDNGLDFDYLPYCNELLNDDCLEL